ncbi:hypothetical protein [Azospirillum brasilense]|jgi:hypothetical protein|uniref:hypothetical protein n=1 Tax=Azospirillum brasilense TaxID=192 RepID=UPI001FFFC071|nr:hypothetical protein [Azospirillum brasilense]
MTQPQTPAAMLAATHAETQAVHADTSKILDLLTPPEGEQDEDRIAQILAALAEVLESLASLHAKIDAVASRRA